MSATDGQCTLADLRAFLAACDNADLPGSALLTGRLTGWTGKVRELAAESDTTTERPSVS